jgi:membrane-bound lytic murein transglycosylase A
MFGMASLGVTSLAQAEMRTPLKIPGAHLESVQWSQIEGWADDDHDAAFAAFLQSCKAVMSGTKPSRPGRPMAAALREVCGKAVEAKPHRPGEARGFFEQNFRPVRIAPLGEPDGFLTGYYEPIVEGVRKASSGYDYPLYRRPPGLLTGGRMVVGVAGASKGKKKAKAKRRKFAAYYDRTAIDDGGVLHGRDLEICWLKDPIDAFFAHIQGSVRVRLEDGETLRLNYEAANGHPYVAVGKFLVQRNIIPKDEMSMDRIREWMERNPDEGAELRRKNKSYVFFREIKLPSDEEPPGAQGIPLTPGRSIAVDRHLHTYGTPFFISAMLPIESLQPTTPFRRLMIAQDTGGAIIGPARADIYFGAGDEAGSVSGRLRHPGRFVMLVPSSINVGPAEEVPLPRPRPGRALLADQPQQDSATKELASSEHHASEAKKVVAKPAEPKKPGAKTAALKEPEPQSEVKSTLKIKPDKKVETRQAAFDRHSIQRAEVKPQAAKPAKKSAHRHKSKTASQSDRRS